MSFSGHFGLGRFGNEKHEFHNFLCYFGLRYFFISHNLYIQRQLMSVNRPKLRGKRPELPGHVSIYNFRTRSYRMHGGMITVHV